MAKSATAIALNDVMNFLGKTSETKRTPNSVVPTAKTRSQINLLASNTAQSLLDNQVNLRVVADGLFNWTEKPRVSKNVIRSMNEALNEPGKYAVAVELAAYLAAWAPLLEPDRLARLFSLVKKTETSYGPARYTLQLHQKIVKIFGEYSPERQEKLAASLWEESHNGRWWNITAGQRVANNPEAIAVAEAIEEGTPKTVKEAVDAFLKGELPWTPGTAELLKKFPASEKIRSVIEEYSMELIKGKAVDPDIALSSSYFSWLEIDERPESPVGSLLNSLIELKTNMEWEVPAKPQKFSELFPSVRMYGGNSFPFASNIFATDGISAGGILFEVVKNPIALADNRDYMGNCTWSYKRDMEEGKYVLYRLHYQNHIYNAAMVANRNGWTLREINSRHNRGNVPAHVRNAFTTFLRNVQFNELETNEWVKLYKESKGQKNKAKNTDYRFAL